VKQCYQVNEDDFKDEDLDLVVSLGGDGTFLKTASFVKNKTLPMLGINTDP
jgi:NAD+ kinase